MRTSSSRSWSGALTLSLFISWVEGGVEVHGDAVRKVASARQEALGNGLDVARVRLHVRREEVQELRDDAVVVIDLIATSRWRDSLVIHEDVRHLDAGPRHQRFEYRAWDGGLPAAGSLLSLVSWGAVSA